jgi:hypothetical protein
VEASTGSLHTREDVKQLLQKFTQELRSEIASVLEEMPPIENTSTKDVYTIDQIDAAWQRMDFNQYVQVDNDSAEYYLSGNRIELDSVDFDIDIDDMWESFVENVQLEKQNDESKILNEA